MKIGRNQICPCQSGKKYKHCCGSLDRQQHFAPPLHKGRIPIEVLVALQKHELEYRERIRQHGDVRPTITAEMGEVRFVASGRKLVYSKNWKVFPDFLNSHLHNILGKVWGESQIALAIEDQHPLIQWRTINALKTFGSPTNANGLHESDTGATNAWFRIAYDFHLIEHNAVLQKKLLRRIRIKENFQGARFEAAVAAMMLAAGYDLRFAEEKGPGKHPEFFATNRTTATVIAVEAKSKHRPGIMGFEGNRRSVDLSDLNIGSLLRDALLKDTEEPLLVFIEVNVPIVLEIGASLDLLEKLERDWKTAQERDWPKGFPCIGVVFYNDVSPWFLDMSLPSIGNAIWAISFWPEKNRHSFDARSLLERITLGCMQRCSIPLDFPTKPN